MPSARLRLRLLALIALACALAACGSRPVGEYPPAAEPSAAPAERREPVGRIVPVGNRPEGIAVDSRTGIVAVAVRDPDQLVLFRGRTGDILRRVPLPGAARHLAMAKPGGPVLVPVESADALVEVSLLDEDVRITRVGDFPHDATYSEGRVLVADESGDAVSVIEDGKLTDTLPAPLQPGGITAGSRGLVALVGVRERRLQLYDAKDPKLLGSEPAGVGPTHVGSDGYSHFYVVDTAGGGLLVFLARPELELRRRVNLPGVPYGIAVDQENRRIYVTLTARNEVVELSNGSRPRALRFLPAVAQPNSVAVDEGSRRVYVAGKRAGVVQIIEPEDLTPAPPEE